MPKPATGLNADTRLRAELVALLRGGNGHVPTAMALDGIPPERINERVDGLPYSLWELVYHLWFTQHDILVFCLNPDYEPHTWPDAYWPHAEGTPLAWADTTQAFLDDLDKLIRLVESTQTDPFTEFDHAPGYTLLREILLVADHNAHPLGQVIALRRQLGLWPSRKPAA